MGWQFIYVAEKCGYLPNFRLLERGLPTGHPTQADSVLNDVEILIFRHIGRILHKLGCSWIEGIAEGLMGMRDITVAARAACLIDLHPGEKILLRWLDGIRHGGCAPINRSIESRHG